MEMKDLIKSCALAVRDDQTRPRLILTTPSGTITGDPMFQNGSFDNRDTEIKNAFAQFNTENDPNKLYGDENFFVLYPARIEVASGMRDVRALAIRYDSVIACAIGTI